MIRVLIVEDEPRSAAAHAELLRRVPGFELSGTALDCGAAHQAVLEAQSAGAPIQLILLDLTLPDGNGLDLIRTLRAARIELDFIAITAIRQIDSVQAALAVGAVQYLIKPFGFPVFRDKLELYLRYREQVAQTPDDSTQSEVDELLATWRPPSRTTLPKGLSTSTLEEVSTLLRTRGLPRSASEVATELHMSRITARRYLEHLANVGVASRRARYGSPGRPRVEYSWR